MATDVRQSAADLEDELIENGPEFDFFQAVRLLLLLRKVSASDPSTVDEWPLNIRPDLNLDYADSQVSEIIDLGGTEGYEILTSFLGLYGVSSPLPAFYTEDLLDDEWDENTAGREFLDIIHNTLYRKLYDAWLKYQFLVNVVENKREDYWSILTSLIGLRSPVFLKRMSRPETLLRYLGILSIYPRSATALKTILSDYLSPLTVEINQCEPGEVAIPRDQRMVLGKKNSRLGKTTTIGETIKENSTSFSINIHGLTSEQSEAFMQDEDTWSFIANCLHYFLVQPLRYTVRVVLDNPRPAALGDSAWSNLGVTTWIGSRLEGQQSAICLGDVELNRFLVTEPDNSEWNPASKEGGSMKEEGSSASTSRRERRKKRIEARRQAQEETESAGQGETATDEV